MTELESFDDMLNLYLTDTMLGAELEKSFFLLNRVRADDSVLRKWRQPSVSGVTVSPTAAYHGRVLRKRWAPKGCPRCGDDGLWIEEAKSAWGTTEWSWECRLSIDHAVTDTFGKEAEVRRWVMEEMRRPAWWHVRDRMPAVEWRGGTLELPFRYPSGS